MAVRQVSTHPVHPTAAPTRSIFRGLSAAASVAALLITAKGEAASLQKVNDWGATGVPSTASMYIYVPDKLATKPPILVLAHFCGGSATAVFGQAQGGGVVKAADQYGFIMVVPQTSKNCWDVGSTKSLTHDGGGDTQAVAQMVKYAITKYSANADRVYATGDSSGGMMTQALLAVYPDVFKGGSAFAGVPAGCWAAGNPDGSWSGQCAGGQVMHTAKEWGDLARGMFPGYTGHRPRVQLVHGDADDTIKYQNFLESVKQWTDVLGLNAAPTSTDTVTLGSHQATRQQWKNSCGYVVLDALTSKGGDHGPSDALFNASYVVPFLALDKTDAVDPEVAACTTGGTGGTGGSGGGGSGAGGAAGASGGSGGASSGGTTSVAGSSASSGGSAVATAGQGGTGAQASGGTSSVGGFAPVVAGTSSTSGGVSGLPPKGNAAEPSSDSGCSFRPDRDDRALVRSLAAVLLVGAAAVRSSRRGRRKESR